MEAGEGASFQQAVFTVAVRRSDTPSGAQTVTETDLGGLWAPHSPAGLMTQFH